MIILGVSGKKKMVVSEKEEEEIEEKEDESFFSSFPSYSSLRKGRSRGRLLDLPALVTTSSVRGARRPPA